MRLTHNGGRHNLADHKRPMPTTTTSDGQNLRLETMRQEVTRQESQIRPEFNASRPSADMSSATAKLRQDGTPLSHTTTSAVNFLERFLFATLLAMLLEALLLFEFSCPSVFWLVGRSVIISLNTYKGS